MVCVDAESPVKDVDAWPNTLFIPLSNPRATFPKPLDIVDVNPPNTPLVASFILLAPPVSFCANSFAKETDGFPCNMLLITLIDVCELPLSFIKSSDTVSDENALLFCWRI